MQSLNLPSFDFTIKEIEGRVSIYDSLRKKFLILTPEEWVRQHFVHFLIQHYKYPKSLIKLESGHTYNQLSKRSDIIIYDRYGNIFLLVECKSAESKISQKTFDQVATYNLTLKAKYIAVTNGINHFVCEVNQLDKSYVFLKDFPTMPE